MKVHSILSIMEMGPNVLRFFPQLLQLWVEKMKNSWQKGEVKSLKERWGVQWMWGHRVVGTVGDRALPVPLLWDLLKNWLKSTCLIHFQRLTREEKLKE